MQTQRTNNNEQTNKQDLSVITRSGYRKCHVPRDYNTQVHYIKHLLQVYGLRIGEVLNATFQDVLEPFNLYIHGSKGSFDRVLYCPEVIQYVTRHGVCPPDSRLFTLSYNQVYRQVAKECGSNIRNKKKNRRVTHRYRADLLQRIHKKGLAADNEVGHTIGHRSGKTINYYLKGE